MPLMEMTIMDQKVHFILLWRANIYSFTDLCKEFGISRGTGYRYVHKYQEGGMVSLEPQSRAPHNRPNKTPEEIENKILEYRKKHSRWGAKKIQNLLEKDGIYANVPARSTISLILKRNGMIPERKKRRRIEPRKPIFDPNECNEIWSADYKGQFKMGNGKYCYPVTICDTYSRYILSIKGLHRANLEQSKPVFEAVFNEYGLPEQLHTDNGSPFANVKALNRLTKFAVWLMELGVQPVYSDPASPQQNGRHERMHRELKAECCKKPGSNLRGQQMMFNRFTKEYNNERPHEALGMVTPSQVYKKSNRLYPEKIEEWDYPGEYLVKYVCRNGAIRVGHDKWLFVGTALNEKRVGLEQLEEDIYRLFFRDFFLGYVDGRELRVYDINEYQYVPRLS